MLDNAVKFTPNGGSVDVDVLREGQEAVLRVSDTGIGIDPEMLPRVFEYSPRPNSRLTGRSAGSASA